MPQSLKLVVVTNLTISLVSFTSYSQVLGIAKSGCGIEYLSNDFYDQFLLYRSRFLVCTILDTLQMLRMFGVWVWQGI